MDNLVLCLADSSIQDHHWQISCRHKGNRSWDNLMPYGDSICDFLYLFKVGAVLIDESYVRVVGHVDEDFSSWSVKSNKLPDLWKAHLIHARVNSDLAFIVYFFPVLVRKLCSHLIHFLVGNLEKWKLDFCGRFAESFDCVNNPKNTSLWPMRIRIRRQRCLYYHRLWLFSLLKIKDLPIFFSLLLEYNLSL